MSNVYSDRDSGISYRVTDTPYGTSVYISVGGTADIQSTYEKITEYLSQHYEPFSLTVADGVCVSYRGVIYYIKNISQDDDCFLIECFNTSHKFRVGSACDRPLKPNESLLEPTVSFAGKSAVFSKPSFIDTPVGKIFYTVNAAGQHFVETPVGRISGVLVAQDKSNPQFLNIKGMDGRLLFWDLQDTSIWYLQSRLPKDTNIFYNHNWYLDIPLVEGRRELFTLHAITEQNSKLLLIATTLQNPELKFELVF